MFVGICGENKKKRKGQHPAAAASRMIGSGGTGQSSMLGLLTILRISMLIIPFNIAYSQMATTFIVQGTVMRKAFGWIDAATMNNADAMSVLLCGHLVGSYFYPALANRGIKIPTTYKFAIGSTLGSCAIAWALFVEYMIHSTYSQTGQQISILWQTVSYGKRIVWPQDETTAS
jgi:POT family proton-dependent oligopeptide transporter